MCSLPCSVITQRDLQSWGPLPASRPNSHRPKPLHQQHSTSKQTSARSQCTKGILEASLPALQQLFCQPKADSDHWRSSAGCLGLAWPATFPTRSPAHQDKKQEWDARTWATSRSETRVGPRKPAPSGGGGSSSPGGAASPLLHSLACRQRVAIVCPGSWHLHARHTQPTGLNATSGSARISALIMMGTLASPALLSSAGNAI